MQLFIFDLDGTLIDSKLDIVAAVNAARDQMGLPGLATETIASYVGNGAPVLMQKAMGADAPAELVAEALRRFLDYYHANPLVHTKLYPGVREALDELHACGKALAVLTNKPEVITHQIVEGLNLKNHFFRSYGGDSMAERKPHPMGIEKLMAESGIGATDTLMVGDSYVDIRTARNAGVGACGVTYGFQPESLITDAPDFLIDDMRELLAHAG
ncbi:phosphoglycolate phosphatase [Bryobacterales bacterium F-183]|nr:phosphoglycolate phosphatase [Bryobacterales bacterium F-183]